MKRTIRSSLGPLLLFAALAPTASFLYQAQTVREGHAEESESERALRAIPTDPTVLINIQSADMPASPDILALGRKATKALERCLADNIDAGNRRDCAVTLNALGDRSALPTLQAAIEDWDVSVRYEVVRALGAIPDASSVDALIKLYHRKDEQEYVRDAILVAFAHISDQKVVKLLRKELRSRESAEVFAALWANRHMMSRDTLVGDTKTALGSGNDSLVLAATHASAELRSPKLVAALIPLMEHQDEEVRNKAVYALGKIGDKAATKALLAQLPEVRESRMLNNIAFALERLDKDAFYKAMPQIAEHKQAVIRLNAAFVLGDVRHAEGFAMLEKALEDPSDYVRTSAVVAVGKLGATDASQTDAAIASLEPLTSHENLTVREEAIYALHTLSKGQRADLIYTKLFQLPAEKYPDVVKRAAVALAQSNDQRVKGYTFECLLSGSCGVDEVGVFVVKQADDAMKGRVLLNWARGSMALTPVVSALEPEGTFAIAKSAFDESRWGETMRASLEVLAELGDAGALPLVNQQTDSSHPWTRIYSLVAAARLGDAGAGPKLVAEIDEMPSEWLPSYVWALSYVEEQAVRDKLDPELEAKQSDARVDVALAAAAVRLDWDPDKGIFRFLDALGSKSSHERSLAERYLLRNRDDKVTWVMRRALAREGRDDVKDRLRTMLDKRR
jgi:HEAT repeat protein